MIQALISEALEALSLHGMLSRFVVRFAPAATRATLQTSQTNKGRGRKPIAMLTNSQNSLSAFVSFHLRSVRRAFAIRPLYRGSIVRGRDNGGNSDFGFVDLFYQSRL